MNTNRTTGFEQGLTSYADPGFSAFLRNAYLASEGHDGEDLARPVVGIAHTISDYVTCHRDMPQLVDAIRRGVTQAGGIAMAFPVTPLGEPLLSPTSMLYRNLASLETEELIRAQPMDAVVLVGGCDKTVPAQIMGGLSAGRPMAMCIGGPMYAGDWEGERIGACTDCRKVWSRFRADAVTSEQLAEAQQRLCPTSGTCMVMGTASTMACVSEALGISLPGGATAPAPSADRLRNGVATGRLAVRLAQTGARLELTPGSFHNALVILAAVGGSTNAIVHLIAIARRAGIRLTQAMIERSFEGVPLLVNCKPSGVHFMEHFHAAGGVVRLMWELRDLLDLDARLVDGRTLGEMLTTTTIASHPNEVVGSITKPFGPAGSLKLLRGSLAPAGAVLKVSAASPELLQHTGRAVVFESADEAARMLDDPEFDVSADDVLVLRNCGPVGAYMPEAGSLPIPKRLARQGVTDMVRVSDARMSGTSYGTVVLHCAPEAAIGGPLSLVRNGDLIQLDAAAGRIDLLVPVEELERRRQSWVPPVLPGRGWKRLYRETVLGADEGADLVFLGPDESR